MTSVKKGDLLRHDRSYWSRRERVGLGGLERGGKEERMGGGKGQGWGGRGGSGKRAGSPVEKREELPGAYSHFIGSGRLEI